MSTVERTYDRSRLLCTDSAKAIKASKYGYINGILYLAPYDLSGKNLCPKSSVGCRSLCLGWTSGQAGMVSRDEDMNGVRLARVAKARAFMRDRQRFLSDLVWAIARLVLRARRLGKRLVVRLNGSSDIAWEMVRLSDGRTLFDVFPDVQFVDYTKIASRFRRKLPANYHLTLSRHEGNEAECLDALARGVNVAVVFAGDPDQPKPMGWNGYDVIDGDGHDLRHLDPRGERGVVVGLSPKGRKAKRDVSGFVVRAA